ncbi:MAG: hypothetical protein ACP5G8_04790 [Athalassotoga sp.]
MKVLWISRHPLDQDAVKDLISQFGDLEITTKDLLFSNDGKVALQQLVDIVKDYDLVGGVFPAQLWVQLLNVKLGKKVFVVVSVPSTASDGQTRIFKYDHIEVVEM